MLCVYFSNSVASRKTYFAAHAFVEEPIESFENKYSNGGFGADRVQRVQQHDWLTCSHPPHAGASAGWLDLLPLFVFVFLVCLPPPVTSRHYKQARSTVQILTAHTLKVACLYIHLPFCHDVAAASTAPPSHPSHPFSPPPPPPRLVASVGNGPGGSAPSIPHTETGRE